MNELETTKMQTPIEIALGVDENGMTTARALYDFLELAQGQFSRWAKTNIESNEFYEENKDWWGFDIMSNGMDSNQFFYERFNIEVDTICFNCHKSIKGKQKDFPYITADGGKKYYFCSYGCRAETSSKINPYYEGEFQTREGYESNGGVYGYIYHIYNRKNNMHYIGQTVYMPFFRWQEHVKSGLKGNITDLVFETITEVRVKSQEYLNNIEAWWIRKYIDEYGRNHVMNITVPKITLEDLAVEYSKIVSGQLSLEREVTQN